MEKKDGRVRIKGFVSKETAEKWRKGEIRSNNGLRQTHGRASLNPEQPEVWIDKESPLVSDLKDWIGANAPKFLDHGMKRLWYEAIEPRLIEAAKDNALPWLFEKLGVVSEKGIADEDDYSDADAVKQGETEAEPNVINLADYRAAIQKAASSDTK